MENGLRQQLPSDVVMAATITGAYCAPTASGTAEPSLGTMVELFQNLTMEIAAAKTRRDEIEAKLKAQGVRMPGMTRQRKAKAVTATRTRKSKTQADNGAAEGV